MKKINFTQTGGSVKAEVGGEMSLTEAVQLILSGLLGFVENGMRQITREENLTPAQEQEVKEDVYDMLNIAFGNILDRIIPTEDIPDITVEATLQAENAMIEEACKREITLDELLKEKKNARTPITPLS